MTDIQELKNLMQQLETDIRAGAIDNPELKAYLAKFAHLCQQKMDNDILNDIGEVLNSIAGWFSLNAPSALADKQKAMKGATVRCSNMAQKLSRYVLSSNEAIYERCSQGIQDQIKAMRKAHEDLSATAGTIDSITKVLSVIEALLGILTYALGLPV